MTVPRTLMWTYPWDLQDEGIVLALDAIAGTSKVEAISLAVAYHISTYFLPHSPRRSVYFGEDGRIFFQPEDGRYQATALRPKVSEVVTGPDFLPGLVGQIRQRGLGFTAWVVYNYNHYLARTFPDCAKQDALGNRYLNQLCPANPEVRAYHLALTADVAANYRPDQIFVESPGFLPYNYGWSNPKVQTPVSARCGLLLGICFCPHCLDAAQRAGLAASAIRDYVATWLTAALPELPADEDAPADRAWIEALCGGDLAAYLRVRDGMAADAYEAIAAECRRHNVGVFGFVPLTGGEDGALSRVLPLMDRGLAPVPGSGSSMEPVTLRKQALRPDAELIAHSHPGSHRSESDYVAAVLACRDAGADGFGCYNYGLVRPGHLRWVGAAVDAWQTR